MGVSVYVGGSRRRDESRGCYDTDGKGREVVYSTVPGSEGVRRRVDIFHG